MPLVLAGAGPFDEPRPIRNVLIVTLDTTRADYLPAYGYTKLETPALDRLSREGTVFEQATTSVPLTLPAHCTIFTGLFPPHHRVRDNADRALDAGQITLAEVLRARGMRTGAFVGSVVVGHDRGLAQGFDTYSAPSRIDLRDGNRRPAHLVVDDALEWLQRQDGPFFAWIHLYDAHAPYALPEPFRTMYHDAPYLGALAVLDAQVGRVASALEAHHVLDRTLLVVASDHGESLGEHGEDGHGIFVYQSTLRVALIMRVPGFAPRRVADVTRLADVMPTVLDLLHEPAPPMDGVSLVPLMTGRVKHLDLDAYRNRRTHADSAGASCTRCAPGDTSSSMHPGPSCTTSRWTRVSNTTSSTEGPPWVQPWRQEWMRSQSPLWCVIQWTPRSMVKRRRA